MLIYEFLVASSKGDTYIRPSVLAPHYVLFGKRELCGPWTVLATEAHFGFGRLPALTAGRMSSVFGHLKEMTETETKNFSGRLFGRLFHINCFFSPLSHPHGKTKTRIFTVRVNRHIGTSPYNNRIICIARRTTHMKGKGSAVVPFGMSQWRTVYSQQASKRSMNH